MTNSKKKTGLMHKYNLTKADGRPVDPKGIYFVLKLNSDDPNHRRACIAGARSYASFICNVIPELATDLFALCDDIEKEFDKPVKEADENNLDKIEKQWQSKCEALEKIIEGLKEECPYCKGNLIGNLVAKDDMQKAKEGKR